MKPAASALPQALPRDIAVAKQHDFPLDRAARARLRKLRDQLFKQGKLPQALEAAREVARRNPGRDSYCRLGVLLRETGNLREALKVLRDGLRFESGPTYLLPEIHLHLAHTWLLLGERKRMGESLKRALALRPKPRTEAALRHLLGNYFLLQSKQARALEEYALAFRLYTDARRRGSIAHNQGLALVELGKLTEAIPYSQRAIEIHRRAGDISELGVARKLRAGIHFSLGKFRQALGMYLRAAQCFRRAGTRYREAEALHGAGFTAGELGLWAKSKACEDRAIRLAESTGSWPIESAGLACRATAWAYLENYEQADADLLAAGRILKGRRHPLASLNVLRARVRISHRLGRWMDVARMGRTAARLADRLNERQHVIEYRKMIAEAEAQLGRDRKALFARKGAGRLETLWKGGKDAPAAALRVARRVAAANSSVLIAGEDGTESGMEALARRIHHESPRARGPLVLVPCCQLAFPAAELAGHAQGAWSGAGKASEGYWKAAEGGTLVLLRVDRLSREAQNLLPRMLDGWVRPVGDAQERPADVRVLATCCDKAALIEPLRRRLEAITLRVAPLRERRGEIPPLVEKALRGRRRITVDALAALAALPWPGNEAELQAAVERLAADSSACIGLKGVQRSFMTPDSSRHRVRVHKERRLSPLAASPT